MNGSPVSYSLREIVDLYGGELVGDPQIRVSRVGTLENAGEGSIAFLANPRYLRQLSDTKAAAVIVAPASREGTRAARIVHDNPYLYFARVSALLRPAPRARPGVHPSAIVAGDAQVDPSAEIGAQSCIAAGVRVGGGTIVGPGSRLAENVHIGRDCLLHAGVTMYSDCTLGDRVIVHSGVVIGADGFGIAFDEDHWVKVPQIGRVRVGDDVEIGANTTIDRGAIDDTVIEEGVKLDNQIQIAHNVRIGAHTAIAACTGIAGSVQIGRYCRIGGAVGIAGHVNICDRVEISGHTSITKSIDQPGVYSGVYPFEPNRQWRRNAAQVRHLAEIARRVSALEGELAELTRSRS
ncbi:MAG: UDP-3-O-(3-hydroxymyristoyl) glucosamine N-acyltransferase [Betaproteobacteria bacterium]|nr:UDP-3-O-(3-hydroxymyristoyl) glucosamine N-acyltransferase [Betaproteobacteria bacterium]